MGSKTHLLSDKGHESFPPRDFLTIRPACKAPSHTCSVGPIWASSPVL